MTVELRKLLTHASLNFNSIPDLKVSGIAVHSDHVKPGFLYVAIKGNLADGHDYIQEAETNGAIAVITDHREMETRDLPRIMVTDTRRVASIVANAFYDYPSKNLNVIGITGTNGKTTTASILYHILSECGLRSAQLGTLGTIAAGHDEGKTLTTLDPVHLHGTFHELNLDGFTHVVMEVSSHSIHQHRISDVEFNIAAFTNLTPEHLDYHGTMEDYFHVKSRLFNTLPITATSIINIDDAYGTRMIEESTAPVVTCSVNGPADIHFKEVSGSINGISGTISAGDHTIEIDCPLPGTFNLDNILMAVSISYVLGLSPVAVSKALTTVKPIPGRFELFTISGGGRVIVDYAHTPDAYEKVLSAVQDMNKDNRRITVFFGAGGNRDHSKRPVMASIAEKFSNRVIIAPDNPRNETLESINEEIISGLTGNNYEIFEDRGKGLRSVLSQMTDAEILVILGKGREDYQEISGNKFYYSDIEIIQEFMDEN